MFWGVLFFVFAVMVWVLSGVVGGGWFWGAEGLGLKGWGFGGVFPNVRGGGPVVVVRGPLVDRRGGPTAWWSSWWWSVVYIISYFVMNMIVFYIRDRGSY